MDETEVETVVRLQAVDVRDLFPDFSPEDASSRICLLCTAKLKDKTHNLTRHLERHHIGALLQLMEQRTAAPPTTVSTSAKKPKAASTPSSRTRKHQQQDQPHPSKGHSQKQRRLSSPHSAEHLTDEETKTSVATAPPPLPIEMEPDQVESAKLALAKWLAHEQLPMNLVANDGFRQFIHSLNESFNPPEHDELQQVLERMHTRHRQVEKENRTSESESVGDGDESKKPKKNERKKQRVEKKAVIVSKALVAVSRTPDDAPIVRYQQLACGVLQRGFVQVRVHLALASLADAMTCRGLAKGKQGVLGRSFVGVVEQVNHFQGSLIKEQQRVALASSLLLCSACTLKTDQSSPVNYCTHTQQRFGMSSSRGALSEYIELPEASLCAVPSAVPDDLVLLVDDLAVVIRTSNVVKQRGMEKIAIVTDCITGCVVGLLAQYLSQTLGFTREDVHIFVTESMSEAQQTQLRQHAMLTTLGIYHSRSFDDVLSKQLAFDGVIDLCGNETSTEFAVRLVQPMGTLMFVDRSRFEYASSTELAMDMNAVVVNELEVVSISDCSAEAADAVAYLVEQARSSENRDALRAFLSVPVALGDALEELRKPEAAELLKMQYLLVDCRTRDVEC